MLHSLVAFAFVLYLIFVAVFPYQQPIKIKWQSELCSPLFSSCAPVSMLFCSSHPAPLFASAATAAAALLGNTSSPALVSPVATAALSLSLVDYIFTCAC